MDGDQVVNGNWWFKPGHIWGQRQDIGCIYSRSTFHGSIKRYRGSCAFLVLPIFGLRKYTSYNVHFIQCTLMHYT